MVHLSTQEKLFSSLKQGRSSHYIIIKELYQPYSLAAPRLALLAEAKISLVRTRILKSHYLIDTILCMFNAMTMMLFYIPPRALEEIVKLGGNPRLEEIIQRLSLIYKETEGEK